MMIAAADGDDDDDDDVAVYKPTWRDEERRSIHRARMALVVRVGEKRALRSLCQWARHPCRTEEDLLPSLG